MPNSKGVKGLVATFDSFDEAVRQELISIVESLLDPMNDLHEADRNKLDDVNSFLRVVEWYSKSSEYTDFLSTIQQDYNRLVSKVYPPAPQTPTGLEIKVLEIRNLPDGSCHMEYEASPKMQEFLMGMGLQKILMDACENNIPPNEVGGNYEW